MLQNNNIRWTLAGLFLSGIWLLSLAAASANNVQNITIATNLPNTTTGRNTTKPGPVINLPVINRSVINSSVFNLPGIDSSGFNRLMKFPPVIKPPVFNYPMINRQVTNRPWFNRPVINPPVIKRPVFNRPVINPPVINPPRTVVRGGIGFGSLLFSVLCCCCCCCKRKKTRQLNQSLDSHERMSSLLRLARIQNSKGAEPARGIPSSVEEQEDCSNPELPPICLQLNDIGKEPDHEVSNGTAEADENPPRYSNLYGP